MSHKKSLCGPMWGMLQLATASETRLPPRKWVQPKFHVRPENLRLSGLCHLRLSGFDLDAVFLSVSAVKESLTK
jgi:hypothetical protein